MYFQSYVRLTLDKVLKFDLSMTTIQRDGTSEHAIFCFTYSKSQMFQWPVFNSQLTPLKAVEATSGGKLIIIVETIITQTTSY